MLKSKPANTSKEVRPLSFQLVCWTRRAPESTDLTLMLQFFNRLYLADMEAPPTPTWKEDFQALKEREPPDSWDAEFPDEPQSPQSAVQKPWRGAATFISKEVLGTSKKLSESKQVKMPEMLTSCRKRHDFQPVGTAVDAVVSLV